ncbi:cation:proton antiporter [Limnospira sp. PMC 917.15]|uniref:cation:proton antiporter n=1 Tax=Limnospira sp. PMC 917.15 TaxID=2981106 RepID=UPI0028E0A739|nr:cation:proton antiporter [Limnospira sp. PMC 917.15]MDT9232998.1 cation:proton antiporter [Limnospira sp. PMC 917.15]
MTYITIVLILLPILVGFCIYLFPKIDRYSAMAVVLMSFAYGLWVILEPPNLNIQLLNNFGVQLLIDQNSGYLILTNALVTMAVIVYCWQSRITGLFFTQILIVHSSLNSIFMSQDFISLYVALEVLAIGVFLLIAYPRSDRSIWVGLRYLFVSNTAMLFYLVGVALVYQAHHSFAFAGLRGSSPEAISLIFMGLLAKGGIFVSGLWLPMTYAESETPVSALLSGIVTKAGVFPLVRLALILPEFSPVLSIFGVAAALLGAIYAIFEQDTKRTLAFSSISQLGLMIVAPVAGSFYALTHGLVKSALFLIEGSLPSRDFKQLHQQPITTFLWLILLLASLSISGFPLLSIFSAKALVFKDLSTWEDIALNIASVGTVIYFAKFIFIPHEQSASFEKFDSQKVSLVPAICILFIALIFANLPYYESTYTVEKITKALATIGVGWLAYFMIFKNSLINLPKTWEKLDHLIGVMTLSLTGIFWLVVWLKIS